MKFLPDWYHFYQIPNKYCLESAKAYPVLFLKIQVGHLHVPISIFSTMRNMVEYVIMPFDQSFLVKIQDSFHHASKSIRYWWHPNHRPSHKSHNVLENIPQYTIFLTGVCTRAHFCYKVAHCGIRDWCIVWFVQQVYWCSIKNYLYGRSSKHGECIP